MLKNEDENFYQRRAQTLKKRMLQRIQKRPDDIIGTGHGEHYLGQTWCLRAKKGLCLLIDKNNTLISHHYTHITQLLSDAHNCGEIHPIFTPVKTIDAPHRPYLVREEIHGRTLETNSMYDIAFANLAGDILAQQLLALKIQPSRMPVTENILSRFDLKPNNFIIQNIDTKECFTEILDLLHTPLEERTDFLYTLFKKGGKIWIFDYGTWLRPDGKGKNE